MSYAFLLRKTRILTVMYGDGYLESTKIRISVQLVKRLFCSRVCKGMFAAEICRCLN